MAAFLTSTRNNKTRMLMGSYCPVTGKLHDSKYQPALALTAFSGPSTMPNTL